ncbi:MAG: 3'-5' exonuclease [Gemmatimonadales bacterium]
MTAVPAASLANRALVYLEAGPVSSLVLARDVLGLARAPRAIAERVATTLVGGDPRVTRLPDGRWVLAPAPADAAAGSPPLDACRFAVVDVETTGNRPRHGDRIIEIAVALLERGTVTLACESLVDPGVPIPPLVTRITGLDQAAVRGAPGFGAVADRVVGSLAGAVFVAHSVRYDWTFLARELERTRSWLLQGPRLCTVRLARRLVPRLPSRSLDAVAAFFGIPIARRHRAGGDAVATARVLERLVGIAQERGAVTLRDLMATRNAECGVRNVTDGVEQRTTSPDNSALRIAHCAF